MLTCGTGEEIYSVFGHSAIRVSDPVQKIDWVYNYGIFDFNTPGFAIKFARGKLDYMVAVQGFNSFMREYQRDKRWVKEQVLNLDATERQRLVDLLEVNILEENRYYKYDFFFDNCATRALDIIEAAIDGKVNWTPGKLPIEQTYREVIEDYLKNLPWYDFGIDLGLGSVVDDPVTIKTVMFMPDYMFDVFKASTITSDAGERPLVMEEGILLDFEPVTLEVSFWTSPAFIFWLLLALYFLYEMFRPGRHALVKTILLTSVGLAGMMVVLLWFATDHQATKANLNILWAHPLHLITPFILLRERLRQKANKVFLIASAFYFAFFLFWIIIPQEFNPTFRPIILMLGILYFYLYRDNKNPIQMLR